MIDKAIFHGDMAKLMNTDSHWTGGNRSFTDQEMKEFIDHLYVYMIGHGNTKEIDVDRLAAALIRTQRAFSNEQDRAKAIKGML